MKLVSPLLKHVMYPCLASTGYLHGSTGNADVCVVTYHGVRPDGYQSIDADLDGALVSADCFRRQLRLLKSHYRVISPGEFLSWCETRIPLPPRSVLLTCDDGLLNTVTDMLPILQAEQLPCLFFVTGASLSENPRMLWYEELYLMLRSADPGGLSDARVLPGSSNAGGGRSLWWSMVKSLSQYDARARDECIKQVRLRLRIPEEWDRQWRENPPDKRRFLTLSLTQLRQLTAAGMLVGAHSLSHPMLSQLPTTVAWNEIAECRQALEKLLETYIWALAYPFGDPASVSSREVGMAERAGYRCAFLNVDGVFTDDVSLFALPRVHVTADMSLGEFEAHVSGFHQTIRRHFNSTPFPAVPLTS